VTTIPQVADPSASVGAQHPDGDLWRRALRPILLIDAGLVAVLTVTGFVLLFHYRPTGTAAFGAAPGAGRSHHLAVTVRGIHRIASVLLLLLSPLTILLVVLARRSPRTRGGWLVALGLCLTVTAGSFSGYLLPWDQLALWAVTTGANVRGYGWLLHSGTVRFVLVSGSEISAHTLFVWLAAHLLIGAVLPGALLAFWLRNRRRHRSGDRLPLRPRS
jgi:quinol-cytochrome oxidoreductase complex cytochrome b subunit